MKSLAVTLVTWAILFALLWYGAHELFYPPADWIAALVVSFLGACGIGSLRKARLERRDARIVARKGAPRDGARVAVAGTLEPLDAMLAAPFSGEPCVYYDYEIRHTPERRSDDNTSASPIVDRGGMQMTPVVIRSGGQDVRLLALPGIEGFEPAELPDDVVARARSYIARTEWQKHSLIDSIRLTSMMMDDRSGSLRMDSKNTDYDDLEKSAFQERRIPAHAKVCAIGRYSAKDNAIVPQDNVGGVRLISGTREEAYHFLRAGSIGSVFLGLFLIVVPVLAAYGLLSMRESYFEEHGQPSVRGERMREFHNAVAAGDAGAVRAALQRGVDVNEPNASGYPALGVAPTAEVAKVLLDAGAAVNQRDKYGYSPVMLQARGGNVEVVRLLVSRGADISTKDPRTKMNALDVAIDNGQEAVAGVLREAGKAK